MPAQTEILAANLDRLSQRDRDFATSLLDSARRGRLSIKQADWIGRLVERATAPEPARTQVADDLSGVLALFVTAAQRLRHPKVRLVDDHGYRIELSIAGERARVPGSINVVQDAGQEEFWLGRIHRDGTFEPSRRASPTAGQMALLQRFAAEPAQVAAEAGKLVGRCVMCWQALEDDRSLAVGYGSTCAKNWGLPWGAAAAKEAA